MSGEYGGCQSYGPVIVCRARGFAYRVMRRCNACRAVRRHLYEDESWYGVRRTCLACGLVWDSDMGTKRQTRTARSRSRDRARQLWPTAGTRAEHRDWLHAELFGEAS